MSDEEKREELENTRRVKQEADQREQKLMQELSESTGAKLEAQIDARQKAAKLFEAMTPGERWHLYENQRETWERMMDATEQEGLRELLQ